MKDKTMVWVVLILLLLGGGAIAFFFLSKKKEDETDSAGVENSEVSELAGIVGGLTQQIQDLQQVVTEPPPAPPTQQQGGTVQAIPLDPETGDGALAIKNRVKSLIASGRADQIRRQQKIGGDFFSGVTAGNAAQSVKIRTKLEQLALSGRASQYEIPLVPSILDGGEFNGRLSEIKAYCDSAESTISTLGRDAFLQRLCDLCNFEGIEGTGGFHLLPYTQKEAHDSFINSKSAFGECKGTDNQKKDCYKQNNRKLATAISSVVTVMMSQNQKYSLALKDEAIADLKKSGWLFLGY